MIDGCLDWQANGLVRPESVIRATESYFEDQDLMGAMARRGMRCRAGEHLQVGGNGKAVRVLDRIRQQAGEKPGSRKAFSMEMVKRGFERGTEGHAKTICLKGLRLLARNGEPGLAKGVRGDAGRCTC